MSSFGNKLMQTVTVMVTEDCNLRCKYCYEENKASKKIDIETVRSGFEQIKKTQMRLDSVIIEFIGGEPLLEPALIQQCIDVFHDIFRGTKWEEQHMFSISTNGTLLGSAEVAELLIRNRFSVGLSLDGCKEVHDLNRSKSFNDVMKNFDWWRKNFPNSTTKSTLNPESLPFLFESFKFLVELGLKNINMNCIYEDVWSDVDSEIYEQQLLEISKYLLDSGKHKCIKTNLFPESVAADNECNWCGSGTCMIAITPDGLLYPCLRFYTNSSKYHIGSALNGVDMDRLRPFWFAHKQESEKCLSCEYLTRCPHCIAFDYECTGSIRKRAMYNCNMLRIQFIVSELYHKRRKELSD